MEKETTTANGQAGETVIVDESSAPEATVSSEASKGLSLEQINSLLGKNYKDPESALKSIKDTFSYVGKKVEVAKPASSNDISGDVARQLKEMKDELFYSKNPQYESLRGFISKIGENPADVVSAPEFKSVFEKASGFDKIQKQKTVLESNPRIGTVRNKLQEARDSASKYDYAGANTKAVDSVLEAYELQ